MKEVAETTVIGNYESLHLSDFQASWIPGCEGSTSSQSGAY
jgi:hypothetical protein